MTTLRANIMSSHFPGHDAKVEAKTGSAYILIEAPALMHVLRMIAIALVVMPIAEMVAFILVAEAVGFAPALLLLLLVSLVGLVLLSRTAHTTVMRMRGSTQYLRVTRFPRDGAGIAGILLIVPGFITGILGLSVLVPVLRRWMLLALQRTLSARPHGNSKDVLDLAPSEWHSLPTSRLPQRRRRLRA